MPSDFTPDPELQSVATRSAELCVSYLKSKFGKTADYSEAFVAEVENVLALLHLSMRAAKPSAGDIEQFCSMFGSYLGETYRRNRGGVWGVSEGNTPTLSFGGEYKSFPWARVYKRLLNGGEDNVLHWYQAMIQYAAEGNPAPSAAPAIPPPLPTSTPPAQKKSFLRRLFGG